MAMTSGPNKTKEFAAAKDPNTDPVKLRKIFNKWWAKKLNEDYFCEYLDVLGQNPSLPEDLLRQLTTHVNHSVRGSVITNPNTPRDILIKLATDPAAYNRTQVAGYSHLPWEDLKPFTDGTTEDHLLFTLWVLRNPNTPMSFIKDQQQHSDAEISHYATLEFNKRSA
jgi:hypothetical protein